MSEEDPTTQELRLDQFRREASEREQADTSIDEAEAEQHQSRAEKASYLRERLEERAESERRAGLADEEPRED